MIKKKVGSITLAVGLITMGALLFAQNFMELPVKDIYRYWPVLLIGLGLEMVLYMIFYGRNNNEVKLSVDGLCLVFIIILGLMANGAKLINFQRPGDMFFSFDGNSIIDGVRYRSVISETYTRENISGSFSIKELKLTNDYGDIKVLPHDAKGIKVEAKVTIKCNDEAKAREYAKDAVEIIEGEVTTISPKDPANWIKDDFARAQVDFVVYVPRQISVKAENSFGDIKAEGIEGNCELDNRNGKIKAADIGGDVDVENSFGGIEVSNVGGKANISNKNGEITANKISGTAVIENHFGDIQAANISGDARIINNNGRIKISDVAGKAVVNNSFGDISLEKIGGGATVESKNGRIEAEDIAGDVKIENAFGDIRFSSDSINNGDIYAKTKFGNIDCEKPIKLTKEGQDTVAQGRLGSGENRIELITSNGNIDIE